MNDETMLYMKINIHKNSNHCHSRLQVLHTVYFLSTTWIVSVNIRAYNHKYSFSNNALKVVYDAMFVSKNICDCSDYSVYSKHL